MNDIIVSIDRSDAARRALQTAAELATSSGANLHVVMRAERTRPVDVAVGTDRFHGDWFADAEQFVVNATANLRVPSITSAVALGDPVSVLCEEAERLRARLIVVGNRRGSGMSRVFGSVTRRVVRRASCAVFVAAVSDGPTVPMFGRTAAAGGMA